MNNLPGNRPRNSCSYLQAANCGPLATIDATLMNKSILRNQFRSPWRTKHHAAHLKPQFIALEASSSGFGWINARGVLIVVLAIVAIGWVIERLVN